MKKSYISLVLIIAFGFLISLISGCGQPTEQGQINLTEQERGLAPLIRSTEDVIPGKYIVVFKDNVLPKGDFKSVAEAVNKIATEIASTYALNLEHVYRYTIKGFSAEIPEDKLLALRNDPRIDYIEEDGIVYAFAQTLPWGVDRIDADVSSTKAGDGTGSVTGVRVYIIDTGIQLNHPDLNVVGGVDFTGKGTADDGNGHGTHVAGIVGAKDDNNYVVGVAPGVELFAVKVLGDDGSGSFSNVISGVDFVTQQKLNNPSLPIVANMSLGARTGTTYNSLDNAVVNSIKAGVVYTIAAGNDGADAKNYSPAHVKEAITVGAYDESNKFATFSNWGSLLDINAPGVRILSTYIGSSTATLSGTSMAAPHVAGAAALYLSRNPSATPQQVRDRLVADGKAWVSVNKPRTTNLSVYVGNY
ncbi:Peptidase inhibitor I9 [Candidatus Kryptobacter tengchongensis]|nr:Peptidase inhibitor I9 [Candidatus Kryptobacter tengchongensis]